MFFAPSLKEEISDHLAHGPTIQGLTVLDLYQAYSVPDPAYPRRMAQQNFPVSDATMPTPPAVNLKGNYYRFTRTSRACNKRCSSKANN